MNAMSALMPMHAAVAGGAAVHVNRIENTRQPVLDLLILIHDQATIEDWDALRSTAEQLASAARILGLERNTNAAGVVRH
jgi:hypothetical protein